jgi:subtilisin-like proprotein convertase family protein
MYDDILFRKYSINLIFSKLLIMKTHLPFFILALLLSTLGYSQSDKIWKLSNDISNTLDDKLERTGMPSEFRVYSLNTEALRTALVGAPSVFDGVISSVKVAFPNYEGNLEVYTIYESSVMESTLQAKYPEIRSYVAKNDKGDRIRFSVSPQKGLSAMIQSVQGKSTLIDPYTKDNTHYLVFSRAHSTGKELFTCTTEEEIHFGTTLREAAAQFNNADDNQLRTFKLAMSVTGEYAAFHGGDLISVNAAINATLTRVNGLYENDLNTRMILVSNNDSVVYLSAASDPYGAENGWATALQNALNTNIGVANYDIGHLMGAIGFNGNAGCIGCVCGNGKGRGYTTSVSPTGDAFDIDFVAHEMGHQMGGNHTYSIDIEGTGVNVEPGSGSTIMGYAGITGIDTDVQSQSDPYFHAASIEQIMNNIKSKTCPTLTPIANATPIVDAGSDITMPIGTAFFLTGSGSDANPEDVLTYCWEQMNSATNANQTIPTPTRTSGPLFRSLLPVITPVRYFPNFADVVNYGVDGNKWERVPSVTRNLAFRLTVRDNKLGGASNSSDDVLVRFDNAYGPFTVSSQNTSGIDWAPGSQQTITWTVNNTNTLTGANTVNIRLSTDGGVTFPIFLASNVPNNGSASIMVPQNISGPFCRILIEPTAHQFYAVNTTPFAIGYTVTTTCQTYTNPTAMNIDDGSGNGNPGAITYSTINVPIAAIASDVNVKVNITHSYVGDLVVALLHPNSSQRLLWVNNCGTQNGMNIVFNDHGAPAITCGTNTSVVSGNYKPIDPLHVFNGIAVNGGWVLAVIDYYGGDTGTLNSWEVEVCSQEVTMNNPNFTLQSFEVYPNPNNGSFTVEFDSTLNDAVTINVYDVNGRNVYQKEYNAMSNFKENLLLDVIQSGVYLVEVSAGNKKDVRKIVVQ